MNWVADAMNHWGERAIGFAWPMLWQSTLLICLLLVVEWALRRKLRGSVRYALWLVVLLKLVLPPSLALPTGLGWWLRSTAAHPPKVQSSSYVVRYGPDVTPAPSAQRSAVFVAAPRTPLSAAGGVLLGATVVSLGLLTWMLVRWRQVAREADRAEAPPEWLRNVIEEARRSAGLRRPVRLRLIDRAVSPAVCGLLRPVIVLPRALTERLTPERLRAVLLHELIHLRRGDVWANCLQALLQVVYWWHPLLWLANARIRRVREEAVDDAVMLALREEAENYAPTLLEVAKLALRRPLASLGLVGILESHSALRQRIERLMDFRPPRTAGLTLASGLCVLAFGALALPMGQAPAPASKEDSLQKGVQEFKLEGSPVGTDQDPTNQTLYFRALRNFFAERGVDFRAPSTFHDDDLQKIVRDFIRQKGLGSYPPKKFSFNDREGTFRVLAMQDLDAVTAALQTSNTPPQINIKVKFIEVPAPFLASAWFDRWMLSPAALKAFEAKEGAELISQASITTLSGRQAQIQIENTETNLGPEPPPARPTFNRWTGRPESPLKDASAPGQGLEVLATVRTNGWEVELNATATVTEFLGYDDPGRFIPYDGQPHAAPVPLPHYKIHQTPRDAVVPDGYTLWLGPIEQNKSTTNRAVEPRNRVLVLVTPTLIDSAGNRIYTDEQVERWVSRQGSHPN